MRNLLFIQTIKDNPDASVDWLLERFRYIEGFLKEKCPVYGA